MIVAVSALLLSAAAAEPSAPPADSGLTERVEVTATRLPEAPASLDDVPAHVTVIEREAIARSGARTLQDLLAQEAGVVLFDQVGNDVQKTFDLRGFTDGSGVKVYLDGVPLNDPRNNALALEQIPLDGLERIEITRGSAASLAGGGSEAGVIQLHTRRAEKLEGGVSLAAASYGGARYAGHVGTRVGAFDVRLAGAKEDIGEFRENSGGAERRLSGLVGGDLGGGRRIELSLLDSRVDLGNPGALTLDEFAGDPSAAPFNQADFTDERLRQAALNFRTAADRAVAVAVNAFYRDRGAEVLSTGRSAALFGGFFLDSDEASRGGTVELTHRRSWARAENRLTVGGEWADGEVDARGFFTPPSDPATVDPAGLAADNRAERRALSLFVQDVWRPHPGWSFTAGARRDRDRVGYEERFPDPANDAAKRFSETSLRLGANWAPQERWALYASYGEAFLAPTAEQLFSFPGFGSNPELRPQDSRTYELGGRLRWNGARRLDLALFYVDTEDEILFDPASALGLFGANVNAGATRRRGFEASYRGAVVRRVAGFASATLLDAEFRAGDNRGNRIPLVPRVRLAAGVDVELPARIGLRVQALHVGEQVLDSDDANAQARLDAYDVVDVRVTWRRGRTALFAEAHNVLDESYATRGIFAGNTFVTPAPGRRYVAGVDWDF
ncbi:MAG TPA: TonB-dependent receptor [Candidatus Polarisedimenticolaceae bacterium]|nr:TonB-dependent receptor [Candidatus Polarisedimenticolaceae bacterium]